MLNKEAENKILDFVRVKPRTIQEIAELLKKNWRTADRYVDLVSEDTGLIETRKFREGTRGALKIVYWNALEKGKGSQYQERLLERVMQGKKKEDFSPLDIYQFVHPEKRSAYIDTKPVPVIDYVAFNKLILEAKNQILVFSGNLSWMDECVGVEKTLAELAKRKVSMKVLTKVNITSKENTEKMIALNSRVGWDAINVRHSEQPLRIVIIDDKIVSMKEVLRPGDYKEGELKEKTYIFYRIEDIEWVEWLQRVFWKMWGQSVEAQERIKILDTINNLSS